MFLTKHFDRVKFIVQKWEPTVPEFELQALHPPYNPRYSWKWSRARVSGASLCALRLIHCGLGVHPRALGVYPRALGVHPRALEQYTHPQVHGQLLPPTPYRN